MNPRVSVVIPCYNTAKYVPETLASVFAQTWTDYEVVVVNDGSPDTPELERALQPWFDRIVYVPIENSGPSGARNAGITAARGELIALLDSDDLWEPNYLEVQVGALDNDPAADIVYPNAIIFGEGVGVGRLFMELSPSSGEVTFTSLVQEKCCPMVSVLGRRSAFVRAGLFDASMRASEDFDMWLRAVKTGSRIIYHDRPLVRYRRRKGSGSSDLRAMAAGATAVLQKVRSAFPLTAGEERAVDAAIARFTANNARHRAKQALAAGDTAKAYALLSDAGIPRTRRGRLILWCLRQAPGLVRLAYLVRSRLAHSA